MGVATTSKQRGKQLNRDIDIIVAHANNVLPLSTAHLGEEYYYQSLPLCVIDAVYSIGVRYEGVKNTVARYCAHFELQRIRVNIASLPPTHLQESTSSLCKIMEKYGANNMANNIFQNRQRTSSRNGILKADATCQFANVLRKHGIEYLQNIPEAVSNLEFESDILSITGQGSGISLKYFFMLAGSDNLIKPDRMILVFLKSSLNRLVDTSEAQDLLANATERLQVKYHSLTPRLLDHEIWKYQREFKKSTSVKLQPCIH